MENSIYLEISQERENQIEKWGNTSHPSVNTMILPHNSLEIPSESRARFLCQTAFKNGYGTWAHILSEEFSEVVFAKNEELRRKELVQLAACCVAWIKDIDNQQKQL